MAAPPVDVTNNPQFLTARSNVYTAQDLRAPYGDIIQGGIVGSTSFKVAQRASGADKSVDVGASGIFNVAWVKGTSTTDQGLYRVPSDGVLNVDIASNSSGNPRIDQVYLAVGDQESAGSNNKAFLGVVTGTATTGATLDNRSGAGALPADSIRLADILLASGYSTVTNSVIRDRRPWARGARCIFADTAGDWVTTATSPGVSAASGRYTRRLEIVSGLVIISYLVRGIANSGTIVLAGGGKVDGSALGAAGGVVLGTTGYDNLWFEQPATVTVGSRLLDVYTYVTSGQANFVADGSAPSYVEYREVTQENAHNGTS